MTCPYKHKGGGAGRGGGIAQTIRSLAPEGCRWPEPHSGRSTPAKEQVPIARGEGGGPGYHKYTN